MHNVCIKEILLIVFIPISLRGMGSQKTEGNENISRRDGAAIMYASANKMGVFSGKYQNALSQHDAEIEHEKTSAVIELDKCCVKNMEAPRTEQGVPLPCQNIAIRLALYTNLEMVDKKIADFNKSASVPTQTREEYEAKQKATANAGKWYWQRD